MRYNKVSPGRCYMPAGRCSMPAGRCVILGGDIILHLAMLYQLGDTICYLAIPAGWCVMLGGDIILHLAMLYQFGDTIYYLAIPTGRYELPASKSPYQLGGVSTSSMVSIFG